MTIRQFSADLSKFRKVLRGRMDLVVQGVTEECAKEMIVGGEHSPGTPVDTGNARASWWISINSMGAAPNTAVFGDGTQGSLSLVEMQLLGAKAGDTVYILNNAEYIQELERGHSKQAPLGFVRLTAAAGQAIVDRVVERILSHG
jgi:hypothetical protein